MNTINASYYGTDYLKDPIKAHTSHVLYAFPRDRREIGKLSYDQKLEWYAYQFQKNHGSIPVELTTEEFNSFWKYRVLIPMKFKRFYYRVKNGEIFKKYAHITEMKAKVKKHSI